METRTELGPPTLQCPTSLVLTSPQPALLLILSIYYCSRQSSQSATRKLAATAPALSPPAIPWKFILGSTDKFFSGWKSTPLPVSQGKYTNVGKKKKKEKGSWEEWCLAATIVLVTLAPAGLSCLGNRWYHNHNYLVSQPTRGLWSQNKWRDFSS